MEKIYFYLFFLLKRSCQNIGEFVRFFCFVKKVEQNIKNQKIFKDVPAKKWYHNFENCF